MNKVIIIFSLFFIFTLNAEDTSTSDNAKMNTTTSAKVNSNTSQHSNISTSTMKPGTPGPSKNHSSPGCYNTYKESKRNSPLNSILWFILGVTCSTLIFSTVMCFFVCNRIKRKAVNKETINLEAFKSQHGHLVHCDEDQAKEQAPSQVRSAAMVSTNTPAINNGTAEEITASEVAYASINYSLLQKKNDEKVKPKSAESDYAEIQLKKLNEGEEGETLLGVEKQDEVNQDEAIRNGGDNGFDGGVEGRMQMELDEVQV